MFRPKSFQPKAALAAAFAMFVSLLVGVTMSSGPAEAAPVEATGWVWASEPSAAAYTPPSNYSYNSNGAINRIERHGTGRYAVIFADLDRADIEAQVVAYGDGSVFCNINGNHDGGTAGIGGDLVIYVICLDNIDLEPIDSRFIASMTGQNEQSSLRGAGGQFGGGINSSSSRGWNSSGSGFDITIIDTGVYNVRIEGQTARGANVQVTAVGGDPFGKWCNVGNWWQSGSDVVVRVYCWSVQWPTTANFHLRFSVQETTNLAYAWADRPTTSSYTPSTGYQWQGPSGSTTGAIATSNAIGHYAIRFSDLSGFASTATVTPYGSGLTRCAISSWSSTPMTVNVRCIDGKTKQPVATRFLAWGRTGGGAWDSGPLTIVTIPHDPGPVQTIPRGPGTITTIPPYSAPGPRVPARG
jgi:hypothetical protein